MTPETRTANVKRRALELGFNSAGVADVCPPPHGDRLRAWLAEGMAGTMRYMARQERKRLDPATIVPGATRAVVVSRGYYHPDPPRRAHTGRVARYARGRDYHAALRKPLDQLAAYIKSLGSDETIARHFVDAGPVPERELAQRAGLGWIGKNTMLIDPQRGSFSFLGTVFTNLDLALDLPFEADRCGTCRRCLDACPTDAFPNERVLDSRRCISYLTIEHRGEIDPAQHEWLGDWVFGCDVCQDVCPWNVKFARPADDAVLEFDPTLAEVDLQELMAISDAAFDRRYGWTPLERPGPAGMRRNARIAAHNVAGEASCPTFPTP